MNPKNKVLVAVKSLEVPKFRYPTFIMNNCIFYVMTKRVVHTLKNYPITEDISILDAPTPT